MKERILLIEDDPAVSQSQKLEWIGRLAAGIAHEISGPAQYVRQNTCFLQEAFGELEGLLEKSGQLVQAVKSGAVDAELAAEIEAAMEDADLEYLVDEIPKAIRQSLEGMDRVTNMVGAMKEFSQSDGDKKQGVDLNRAIENVLTVSRNEWKYVADVVTELDPELGPVPCLLDDFYRAMLELVINAAQAIAETLEDDSRTKGTITVSTRRDGDWVEIRVRDTGRGVRQEHRGKVFDPLFTTKEPGEGTGRGLAVARSIVVGRHGGTISFDTEGGRGTTFVVRLPAGDPSGLRGNTQHEEAETAC